MLENLLQTFTDRREALALFELLRERDAFRSSWPLLPILAFIAPAGSGKSMLIEYLISGRCSKDGHAHLPFAYIDFTHESDLRDLLSILIALRDQLQSHADEQGRHLTFPRFDLGAAIAKNVLLESHLPRKHKDEIRDGLKEALAAFQAIDQTGTSLDSLDQYIPLLFVGLKLMRQIKPVRELLHCLQYKSTWQWFCTQEAAIGLSANSRISDVLMRLYALSVSSRPHKEGRDYLVNSVLPAAFLADLQDALDGSARPRTWNATTNIVLFFDGYEALLESPQPYGERTILREEPYSTAIHLLEVLALSEHRKQGKTDPLLFVLGSRKRLLEHVNASQQQEQQPSWEHQTQVQDELLVRERADEYYMRWKQQLPQDTRYLRLNHLYLPLWLYDFGQEDTRHFLHLIDRQEQAQAFSDERLVESIHCATHGHPLYLALAAAAVLEAKAGGRDLAPSEFEQAPVPATGELEELTRGQQDRPIGQFLLALFLRQLSEKEQDELTFCAIPRALDRGTLRTVLQIKTDLEVQRRLDRYRHFTFVSTRAGEKKLLLHPVIRDLLQKRLPPSNEPQCDYYQLHMRLREYFKQQKRQGNEQAAIEETYHALALGDPAPALETGVLARRSALPLWKPLVEAIAQAPAELMPADTEQRADHALTRSESYHEMQHAVAAIVLYTWLLMAFREPSQATAHIQNNLGTAYSNLPGGDREFSLQKAITCFEAASQVYTREAFPVDWAKTQNNLGIAYRNLANGDRGANLQKAIACYQAALQVYTREALPVEWAATQNNLGVAYRNLPGRDQDREVNLRQAITCFEAALQIYTREAFPIDWAMAQINLGTTYSDLPAGNRDQEANLQKAIACCQAALQVYTCEAFPVDWAMAQNNLGTAYSQLPGGDWEANLQKAIACYQAALQVYTREALPVEWAATQNNLGAAYRNLPRGDREANLQKAIACYQAALQTRSREAWPREWAETQNNLGTAYSDLPGGDREANLQRAITCYQAALQIYTREVFPVDWAKTENSLGAAYSKLPGGDREANLKMAITCFEVALQVRTYEAWPVEWARTQNNLGAAYSDLLGGDREANLQKAITCFEAALEVFTHEAWPSEWAATQTNLGTAHASLPSGDREVNLQKAITCFEAALQIFQLINLDYYSQEVSRYLEVVINTLRLLEQSNKS